MKRVLVFQHIEREHPSIIAAYAAARGVELHVVKLWEEGPIPAPESYDALIVLGGPMGVYEDYPRMREELAAIKAAVNAVPILAICLGAQLLAHVLGASVYPYMKDGKRIKEIGYSAVSLTEAGEKSPLFVGLPKESTVLQWHGDTFDLPEGAELLATNAVCPNQAFAFGDAYGLQFHAEATPEIVADWVREDAAWTHDGFDMDDARVLRDAEELAPVMKEYCYRMMDNFLSV